MVACAVKRDVLQIRLLRLCMLAIVICAENGVAVPRFLFTAEKMSHLILQRIFPYMIHPYGQVAAFAKSAGVTCSIC